MRPELSDIRSQVEWVADHEIQTTIDLCRAARGGLGDARHARCRARDERLGINNNDLGHAQLTSGVRARSLLAVARVAVNQNVR